MPDINRRGFLKLAGAANSTILLPRLVSQLDSSLKQGAASFPNIIVFLFDAMSARNLSVYGYPRPTAANLERFAERATVYHSHSAGGNYTIPGTASLLTGTYPWTHRAINYGGQVKSSMVEDNIFHALGKDYHRLAFGQNAWAQFILTQFIADIDTFLPSGTFGELDYLLSRQFPQDQNMAARALDDFVFKMEREPASLVFGPLHRILYFQESTMLKPEGYPRGLPQNVNYPLYFRLENVFDGLASLLQSLPSPFFTYLHLFPPHAPYRASGKFYSKFLDRFSPVKKPVHRFSDRLSDLVIKTERRNYDEYVASLDWEFGRFLDAMEKAGIFENSYIVITSDHGEMFERGHKEHATVLLYDPVVHIPLMISEPEQETRRDVYTPTHAVDLLPTLLQLAGKPVPSWGEGKLLPGLGGVEDMQRSHFTVEAKDSPAFQPFKKATIAMQKGNYKLIYYTGYEPEDTFELYDLNADIEELNDLYPAQPTIARQMKEEFLDSLLDANKPYMK
jgi:arylsulfatase A-like enzyme